METKSARLTILIDPAKKAAFDELCAAQDLTPSQVVRQLIREYLEQHGVTYKTKSPVGARVRRYPVHPAPHCSRSGARFGK